MLLILLYYNYANVCIFSRTYHGFKWCSYLHNLLFILFTKKPYKSKIIGGRMKMMKKKSIVIEAVVSILLCSVINDGNLIYLHFLLEIHYNNLSTITLKIAIFSFRNYISSEQYSSSFSLDFRSTVEYHCWMLTSQTLLICLCRMPAIAHLVSIFDFSQTAPVL